MELFVRIVERGSFSAAAADLRISRPVATSAIKEMEQRLGVRLLQRTTRHVQPTEEGQAYFRRCLAILADIEDADRGISGKVAGVLHVGAPGYLARTMLLPSLPAFLASHPALTVRISESERYVDLVREGIDCVVRGGVLGDSEMIARQVGNLEEITCASPDYLARHGVPRSPKDLEGHLMIGFVSSRTDRPLPLEFTVAGAMVEIALPSRLQVSAAETSAAAARRGMGIVQAPRARFVDDLASGALVEILETFRPSPTPVSVLYPSSRQLSLRVRVFVDWLISTLGPQIGGATK
ncbi:DNA-binding transcriptional regulator, LysR family [Paracoccus laeviglucosivorans]|uniref:DNA-binding transcriptional regulator, LysR family n=2 Tax=Paracoccus laeviglucosivorans TaxID=1197861 RepID=A0A521BXJ3_9RHOB|nr:DNA-binding transcriptional regulator, LysR family [Paracoccus laeviglucosivorans]